MELAPKADNQTATAPTSVDSRLTIPVKMSLSKNTEPPAAVEAINPIYLAGRGPPGFYSTRWVPLDMLFSGLCG